MSTSKYNGRVFERGNGMPNVGDYVSASGDLYRVTAIGRYETGRSPGMGMWALARLEWADWSDLTDEEAEAVVCSAKLDVEDDPSDWETPTCAGTA